MKLRQRDLFTRLVRSRPLLLAAMLYLFGCIIAYYLMPPRALCYAGMVLPALLFAFLRKRRPQTALALLMLSFVSLGCARFEAAWNQTSPLPDQRGAQLSGRIASIPVWNPETERSICEIEDLSIDSEPVRGVLRLYLRGDIDRLQSIEQGQRIQCTAHIWEADTAVNPGEFNFSNYLRLNGLRGYATAEIESAVLQAPVLHLRDWPQRIRAQIGARIDRLFPRNADLARAFIIGDRSALSDEDRKSYNLSGVAHLLAISGMHISVLAGGVSLLLQRMLKRRGAYWVTMAILIAYGGLIGYSASLVRAIIMFGISEGARLCGRYSDSPTRLACAMLIYLLIRPIAILDAGFVLSYGSTAGITLLYPVLTRLFHAEDRISKRRDVGIVHFLTRRLPALILQSLLLTLSAQIAILPAAVHFFGSQPVWSFVVNLLAVPLAMSAYILALIGTILGLLPLTWIADWMFGLLTGVVRIFANLPLVSIGIARFPAWLTVICALSCFCASDLSKLPEKLRRFLPFFVVLAILISNGCAMLETRGASIVFLAAGEADCAVLRCEGKVYLVDTGDPYSPAADYLSAKNAAPEGIFLTHPHSDHAGGLNRILEICTPKRIYISRNWDRIEKDEGVAEALLAAQRQGAEIVRVSAGDTIALSDKTLMEVLSPEAGFPTDLANEDSLVLRLNYGDCSALFTGDAPAKIVENQTLDVDILKIAHHGGKDSLSADLLRQLSPSVAVIPVGYNLYGHPAESSLKLLNAAGVRVYRTDRHGAITCRMQIDGSVHVRSFLSSEDIYELE